VVALAVVLDMEQMEEREQQAKATLVVMAGHQAETIQAVVVAVQGQ
jgi:hypothetical protein